MIKVILCIVPKQYQEATYEYCLKIYFENPKKIIN